MTLIECFTESHLDNVAACLRLRPERMVVVGDENEMGASVLRYRNLLKGRGWDTEVLTCDVGGKDFRALCNALRELVEQEECVIDLTGGDELTAMAFGAVIAGLDRQQRQKIRVEKYDHSAKTVVSCIDCSPVMPPHPAELTVAELVMLHGGSVQPGSGTADHADLREIDGLWPIAAEDPKQWNRSVAYLNEFESRADLRDDETRVRLRLGELRGIGNFAQKETAVRELLEKMHRHGVIDDRSSREVLDYTYRSVTLREAVAKAGNVLEMKTLLEGSRVMEGGAPLFGDCRMSVTIDWDGVAHNPRERLPDTRNEIDVVLMHGMTPLFISCKNGGIGEEELYKLNTVARRFGGPGAKKMLIATDLDQKSAMADRAFSQRAWDMDIFLVSDAGTLTDGEWKDIFVQAIQ